MDNAEEILGVTRAISDPDNVDAEFAVQARSLIPQRVGPRPPLNGRKLITSIPRLRIEAAERYYEMPNNRGHGRALPENWDFRSIFSSTRVSWD